MDPAFVRRLRHVIEFTRPQPEERLKLWRQALTAVAPQRWSVLSNGVDELAADIDVSGAQIKHAVLSGLFIARRQLEPLDMAHVIAGLDRELAKEGRPLGPNERERWLGRA
jgi:SpoVK/Ycf46/Vps4 family AAA+-type ATPase